MMKKNNILISGSLVYDRIMDFQGNFKDHLLPDKMHVLSVSFVTENARESFGGTAGNIAYNLSLLKENPVILSCVGKDFEAYDNWLRKNKIDISQVKTIKDKNTAFVYIVTDKADNQIAAFNPGAMGVPRGSFDRKLLNKNNLAIIAPGNQVDMESYAKSYKQAGIRYIFDPGQQIPALSLRALKTCLTGAEILIGNDYEIELIKQKLGWTLQQITGKVKLLIVTKGEGGSDAYFGKTKLSVPAAKVLKSLDPTGAGDAYRAGLIKGLVDGWPLEKAMKLAGVVAAYAVESHGTQNHRFSLSELVKRYKKNFKETIDL